MHHIISDAWSVRILMKELRALYDAFNSGEPSPLEPLTIQNRDYAAWHNRLLDSEEMDAHRDYWSGGCSRICRVWSCRSTIHARPRAG